MSEERPRQQDVTNTDVGVGDVEHGPVVDMDEVHDITTHHAVEVVPDSSRRDEEKGEAA
jgi:hypothetical protein